jgi:putative flippase GtrA
MRSTGEQVVRFAAGGAVGTAFHYATLVAWVEMVGRGVVSGTLLGFCVGALVNYVIARRFVFETSRSHSSALPRFAAVAGTGAAINTVLVAAIFGIGVHYLVAQVIATVAVLAWNFFLNKHWTFTE